MRTKSYSRKAGRRGGRKRKYLGATDLPAKTGQKAPMPMATKIAIGVGVTILAVSVFALVKNATKKPKPTPYQQQQTGDGTKPPKPTFNPADYEEFYNQMFRWGGWEASVLLPIFEKLTTKEAFDKFKAGWTAYYDAINVGEYSEKHRDLKHALQSQYHYGRGNTLSDSAYDFLKSEWSNAAWLDA